MQRSAINYTRLVFKPTRQNMHVQCTEAHTSPLALFSVISFFVFFFGGGGTISKKNRLRRFAYPFVSMDHPKGDLGDLFASRFLSADCFFFFFFGAHNAAVTAVRTRNII